MGTTSQSKEEEILNVRNLQVARGRMFLQELKDLGFPCTHLITDEGAIKLTKWVEKKEDDIREEAPNCDDCDEKRGDPPDHDWRD